MPRLPDAERDEIMSETRRLLLDAATEEFARQGYEGANINRIALAAGFAKGTIYNYFPSKRALMLALIDNIAASHLKFVARRVLEEGEPARRLERFFEAGAEWIVHHLAQGRVMLNTLNGPDREFKARMGQAYQPMHQLLGSDILAPGVEEGVFRDVDLRTTAALLMILYLGVGTTVDEQGNPRLTPQKTSDFALYALCVERPPHRR